MTVIATCEATRQLSNDLVPSHRVVGQQSICKDETNAAGSACPRPWPNADNVHYVKLVIERPSPAVPMDANSALGRRRW